MKSTEVALCYANIASASAYASDLQRQQGGGRGLGGGGSSIGSQHLCGSRQRGPLSRAAIST